MDVDALREACAAGRVPRLLYTIPNFQNPSGRPCRRASAGPCWEVCDEFGVVVLEDDPYGKLRFEGEALPGLAELAGPGRVIFTSSFSKTVAPGLRVGYMVCPPEVASLAAAASRTYISPALLAEAVHRLVAGGHLPDNVARVTELMRERRDAMVAGPAHARGDAVRPAGRWLLLLADAARGDVGRRASARPRRRASPTSAAPTASWRAASAPAPRLQRRRPAEIAEGMARLGGVFRAAAQAPAAARDLRSSPRPPGRRSARARC